MRSPVPVLLAVSALGLVALAVLPVAAFVVGGGSIVVGALLRARGDRASGFGLAATGSALVLAAVVVLALANVQQDTPVILGPDTGLTPGG